MIQFDPDGHIFTYRGHDVPSLTNILKAAGYIDGRFYTEDGRLRGQHFHQASALLDRNLLDWDTLDSDVINYLLCYEKAKEELGLRVRENGIEKIVHKGSLWAGIVDRDLLWKGKKTIVELKSGSFEWWHRLQMVGYGATYPTMPQLLLLYCTPMGYKIDEKILKPEVVEEFHMAWHQVVSLHHFRSKWK